MPFSGQDMEFLESLNIREQNYVLTDVMGEVFNAWLNDQLDEGSSSAEREIVFMSNDSSLKERYNAHYNLDPADPRYVY